MQAFLAARSHHPILREALRIILAYYQGLHPSTTYMGPSTLHDAFDSVNEEERGSSVELLQEWMHDTFDVPCLRVVSSAECILTAAHRETGVVVDIGNRMEVTAICHGYENRAAHFFTFFGGFDLTEKMQKLLATAGINTGDSELVRKIKEEHGDGWLEADKLREGIDYWQVGDEPGAEERGSVGP